MADADTAAGDVVEKIDTPIELRYRYVAGHAQTMFLRGIQQGSPAAQVGLLPDDRIIAVNRSRISSLAQLREAAKGQTSMLLQLRRGNQVLLLPLR